MNFSLMLLKIYSAVLRLFAPNSGLTTLAFNSVINRLFSGQKNFLQTRTYEGIPIEANVNDYHGRILWLFGSNDFKVSRSVNALLDPGNVFLDIGANYSTIGLSAIRQVTDTGHVHLFEPQSDIADIVQVAIDRSKLGEFATLHRLALFDKNGSFTMTIPLRHSGTATLVRAEALHGATKTLAVQTVRTGDYIRPLVRDRLFGVKIDIEGAEPMVLPDLLRFPNMRFCVFEGVNNQEELFRMFLNAGYSVFGLCRTILTVRVESVKKIEDFQKFHDLIAVKLQDKGISGRLTLDQLRRYILD